jgi:hypothetical protein
MAKEVTATFKLKYDCKGSRGFTTADEDFPIQDIYLKRPFSDHVESVGVSIKVKTRK